MKSLILGVNGQDGILLSNFLIAQGNEVLGVGIQPKPSMHLSNTLKYHQIDIRETEKIVDLATSAQVEGIYNLAGQSSVSASFQDPELSMEVNFRAVKRILQSLYLRSRKQKVRFFQASSSEMFGRLEVEPQHEYSSLNPQSPYAEAKAQSHLLCSKFRDDGHFVSCGILFNHESIYRPTHFVSRKITHTIARIMLGLETSLSLGNLDSTRDWGAARDYIQAIEKILKHTSPDDFIIATGKDHTVKDLVMITLNRVGLADQFSNLILIDESLKRPIEVTKTIGNPKKISRELGWKATTSLVNLINEMVDYDVKLLKDSN